jgi:putative ATPase
MLPVPEEIRTHSKHYRYPHDFGGWVEQNYLEKELKFYDAEPIAYEKVLKEWLEKIRGEEKGG